MIWIPNQLVGAMVGEQITLECHSEAYPKSINYWTRENGNIISQGRIITLLKLRRRINTLAEITLIKITFIYLNSHYAFFFG